MPFRKKWGLVIAGGAAGGGGGLQSGFKLQIPDGPQDPLPGAGGYGILAAENPGNRGDGYAGGLGDLGQGCFLCHRITSGTVFYIIAEEENDVKQNVKM